MTDHELITLPNGIRLVYKQVTNTKIVHCGFILDIGSRDEKPDQQGIAHFWEHMAFKGTRKRKAFHILNRLDSVGGELNAYTTKEKICFYASVLDHHFEKALDLLTDITFGSIFPELQIERERNVILEEMAMYKDSPEDAIQDDFDALVYGRHPMGHNILGTKESIRSFVRKDFKSFIQQNLNTEKLIFSCVGSLPSPKVARLVKKYLKDIPHYASSRERLSFQDYKPHIKRVTHKLNQSHCALGRTSYHIADQNRLPFFMLANLLGGSSLNSRLNLALREKFGFVYSVEASYTPFTDTGLFAIFFGTEPKQLEKSQTLIWKELLRLKQRPLGEVQLHQIKEQLMGQMAMAEENNISLMLMLGKSLLDLGRIDSLKSIFRQIEDTTSQELQDIAHEMFDKESFSSLAFTPN